MQFNSGNRRKASFAQRLLCGLTFAAVCVFGMPEVRAAERVIIRLGPFQQLVEVADLEEFAKTGKLPSSLQLLSPFLTEEVREMLSRRLQVDPKIADKFIADIVKTPAGKQLIASLGVAIPGSTVETIQSTLYFALRQANGLNALGFLRAYPDESVTIDASEAIGLAMKFNTNRLQSEAIGVLLSEELPDKNNTKLPSKLNPALSGQESVNKRSLTLQDRQRNRTIPVDIYWGRSNEKQPLVVMSHGFGASRKAFEYLARHLASYGITVAAIEHPGSNIDSVVKASDTGNMAELMPANEFIDRPKDVSFVLDEIAKLNNQPGELQGKINTDRVSVIGHSLGGYTALALVGGEVDLEEVRQYCKTELNFGEAPGDWLQCAAASLPEKKLQLKDERVKSAIALNPLIGKLFGKNGLSKIVKPVLVGSSTEDSLTPALRHQIRPFTQLGGTKYLLTAIGGTHLSVSDPAYVNTLATTLVKERLGEETKSLRQLTQGVTVAFIKQLTPEAQLYQPFLTPAYAETFSTAALPLRLVSDLPGRIKPLLEYGVH